MPAPTLSSVSGQARHTGLAHNFLSLHHLLSDWSDTANASLVSGAASEPARDKKVCYNAEAF